LEVEDAGLGVWERDGGAGCEGEGLREGGEDGELASRADVGERGGDCCVHVVDGAEDDDVELAAERHGFYAGGPDFGLQAEGTDDFAEEGGLFVLGFGEGDGELGVEELDGESGESGTGAEVEEGRGGSDVLGSEEAFAEVAADDLFGVADGGEVGAGVPLEEEVEISGELGEEGFGQTWGVGGEEGSDFGFGEGGHGCGVQTAVVPG
jgi:hypothetical protein